MTVEVVGTEVSASPQHRSGELRVAPTCRRTFRAHTPHLGQQRQAQRRRARFAPAATGRPAAARICARSAVVVDLPLVPVMPAKRALLPARRTAWKQQFRIGKDGRARCHMPHWRCGAAPGGGAECRREHECGEIGDVGCRVHDVETLRSAGFTCKGRVIPADDRSTHVRQGTHSGESRAAKADNRIAPACEQIGRKRGHRIFSVARPQRARMTEIIQKRMTIVASCHPFFSK